MSVLLTECEREIQQASFDTQVFDLYSQRVCSRQAIVTTTDKKDGALLRSPDMDAAVIV